MSFWTAVVVIVAIIAVTEIIKARHRRPRQGDDDGRLFGIKQEDADARREIENLRERIKVLERIATDGNTLDASETRRISQEIEALRDRQDSQSR